MLLQEPPEVMPPSPDCEQTFAEHIEELRRRLAAALVALLAAVAISFTQVERMLDWLKRPAAGVLPQLAYFHPTEPITAYIKLSVLAGLVLAMPFILWQAWGFVRIGLKPHERTLGLAFVGWGSFQFAAGVAFAYFFLLPASLQFLLNVGRDQLQPMISIDAYLSFVTAILGWAGLIFELPVVLFVLAKAGIVTAEWLRQQRALAILVLSIIAAVVTPTTDPVNLLLMAAPLILLYECSIWLTQVALPNKTKGGG